MWDDTGGINYKKKSSNKFHFKRRVLHAGENKSIFGFFLDHLSEVNSCKVQEIFGKICGESEALV